MEPELPKLPKNKIKPNIQPNKIIGGGKVTYGGTPPLLLVWCLPSASFHYNRMH